MTFEDDSAATIRASDTASVNLGHHQCYIMRGLLLTLLTKLPVAEVDRQTLILYSCPGAGLDVS
jgi:hypothetical protein